MATRVTVHATTVRAVRTCWSLLLCGSLLGCGEPEWKCAAPPGSIATEGELSVDFTGETASFASDALRAYVTVESDDAVALWACQKRSDEMWIVEARVSKPADLTLPAPFQPSASGARWTGAVTRYDQYQVDTEDVGDGLGASISGTLTELDATSGVLVFDGELREPCTLAQCQADERDLSVTADLTWQPR